MGEIKFETQREELSTIGSAGVSMSDYCYDSAEEFCISAMKNTPERKSNQYYYCIRLKQYAKCFKGTLEDCNDYLKGMYKSNYCGRYSCNPVEYQPILHVIQNVAMSGYCYDLAKDFCTSAMKNTPERKSNQYYYCIRLKQYAKCFKGTLEDCNDYLKGMYKSNYCGMIFSLLIIIFA
ncbi:Hypothetical predicted protein [Octopus vulgaris]|uniref:Uncharacterized protein n=1 Tax=Octopus vulgaris TaxID=6645 RepID=A0AA36BK50_OCTVU|nr:Hypothetical predicted protein [Octopus vulgaris]